MQIVQKKLVDLFPEIAQKSEISSITDEINITYINAFPKIKSLEIGLSIPNLIPIMKICNLEGIFEQTYNLKKVTLKPSFSQSISLSEIITNYNESLLKYLFHKQPSTRGILKGCTIKEESGNVNIFLQLPGATFLRHKKVGDMLEQFIKDGFNISTKVLFHESSHQSCSIEDYSKIRDEKEVELVNSAMNQQMQAQAEAASSNMATSSKSQKNSSENKFKDKEQSGSGYQKWKGNTMDRGRISSSGRASTPDAIVGRPFNEEIMPMNEVTQDSGRVAIQGEIFNVEFKEIKSGKSIVTIEVTDFKGSVQVKFFAEPEEVERLSQALKTGVFVKVRGEAQYDKFTKEMVVMAIDIVEGKKVKRQDHAEKKRVELHLHTQMSSMDGVTPVKDLVKQAAAWGHKSIAITDHGVVQAYPDAFDAGKKNNIKIIYGLECYLLNDSNSIVYHPTKHSFDGNFVVLDIETTGLNPEKDRITELGAVKIRNGNVIETFESLVNPGVPIPGNIVKLTGITDEMVKDAPPIEQVLLEFLEFINGAALAAHNSNFDMGFIRHNLHKMGEKINNPVVDTLQMSRAMFPELNKFKLNLVAKHLNIPLENHHRAVDDAKAAAGILTKCFELLSKQKNLTCITQIDNNLQNTSDIKGLESFHAIILVKNTIGLKNLYKIVSESHLKYFYKKPRVPKRLLMSHKEGLIIGSACEAGELYKAILDGKSDDEIQRIARFYDYLEIQPLGNNQFLLDKGKVKNQEELININKRIVKYGERLNKPVVATCDVHFMEPRDEVFRRILQAGQGFDDADKQAPLYLRTTEEMLKEFSYLGDTKAFEVVVENTNMISDMIESIPPVPSGVFPPKIEGAEEEIKTMSENKAKEIYGDPLPEVVAQRMEKELNSIIKNGFAVMYLIAQKLVHKSVSDGYLVGSRGSVGSSFIANMAGITEVNSLQPHYICTNCKHSEFILDGRVDCGFDLPDKTCPNCGNRLKKDGYDIPFETFLGFDGDKEPDIDLNFSGEYQPKAHKYTEELFGEGYVFRAGTIASVAEKTAFGYVKNYLDERGKIVTNAEINRLIKGCTGVKRTTGQHPGGIMIVPQDKEIYDFSPIQRPADDTSSEITTTHFDYHFLHGSILKLDILGHDDPTVIKMLEDLTGVDATQIEIGEKNTMAIFSGTEVLGIKPSDVNSDVGTFAIPEFGTKFVRQMLVDTKPTTFSELIRISGLSHGTDVWLNNAQDLIRSGICNLSQSICCRDDIMIYLMHAGLNPKTAFKIMEDVRKGKGVKTEYEEAMREKNVPDWYIDSCKKIKYMFPKAHAAAYVMMAFRIAWFKVNHPKAFYVAYFTVRADDFDAELMTNGQDVVKNKIEEYERKGNTISTKEKNVLTILEVANEMYARGINFLPVDLYKSDPVKFIIEENGIRPPFNSLQGLGINAANNIIEARDGIPFSSIEDLRIRAKISKSVIEILKSNGCLHGLDESNQMSLF